MEGSLESVSKSIADYNAQVHYPVDFAGSEWGRRHRCISVDSCSGDERRLNDCRMDYFWQDCVLTDVFSVSCDGKKNTVLKIYIGALKDFTPHTAEPNPLAVGGLPSCLFMVNLPFTLTVNLLEQSRSTYVK